MAKKNMTKRQNEILAYIWSYVDRKGRPPTIREIGEKCNISSTSVVNYNLNRLSEQGYLEREKDVSRGLRLTEKAFVKFGELSESLRDTINTVADNLSETFENMIRIPLVGDIVASKPLEVGNDGFDTYDSDDALELSASLFKGDPKHMFALRVHGDSMIDAMIADGDIVIMQQDSNIRDGDMVAVWLRDSGTTTLKKIYREGPQVRLQPANKEMEPIYVGAKEVDVQGKVMMVLRQSP